MDINKVAVEGETLGFRVVGSGIPCLSIGSATSLPGDTFSDALKEKVKFILADSRIVGSSRPLDVYKQFTLKTFLDDTEQIRRAAGEERVVVLGHSALGLIALEYARRYPKHVSHAVLLCTPPTRTVDTSAAEPDFVPFVKQFWEDDASEERKEILRGNQALLTPERFVGLSPGEAFGVWANAHAPMQFYDPTYDFSWAFETFDFDAGVYAHLVGTLLADYDVGEVLRKVSVPVFLALGRYDYLVPHVMWEGIREVLPNLTTVVFEKSGHYPMMEESERFNHKLIAWLRKGS